MKEAEKVNEVTDTNTDLGRSPQHDPASLDRWMRDQLRGRRLVVEAGLSERLLEELRAALSKLQLTNSNSDIAHLYPALYLGYLTTHGIFRY